MGEPKNGKSQSADDTDPILEMAERMWECITLDELDNTLDAEAMKDALRGMPDDPSEMLGLYAANRERLINRLPLLPLDDLDMEAVAGAAYRLGTVYLFRTGFLLHFAESSEGITFIPNPAHPLEETLERLKKEDTFLYRLALLVYKREYLPALARMRADEAASGQ